MHLRQGELDGACGPYCVVSALITLGLMDRTMSCTTCIAGRATSVRALRDALYALVFIAAKALDGDDLLWLTDYYKRVGLQAEHVKGKKHYVF